MTKPESVGNRIIVLGSPGSGKSVFSVKLSKITGLPLYHLDSVWWKADRTHISRCEFDEKLGALLSLDKWILDGDYSRTYEVRIRACDTVVFLDFDTGVCMKGINERIGKERPDMPWIENESDPELVKAVENYGSENRPVVLSLLEKYPEKRALVFSSRADADGWLSCLAGTRDLIFPARCDIIRKTDGKRP